MQNADSPLEKSGLHGRGSSSNPTNRFEVIERPAPTDESELSDLPAEELPSPQTVFLKDAAKSILTRNDSPDVGFEYSLNPYRGCEHGCIYCYARPTHEYLGFSAGLDFETKILVKEQAPELLKKELSSKNWVPQTIVMSGVTDLYQPIERKLQLTRHCLEVLNTFKNPVFIITKNALITRDIDLLSELAQVGAAGVLISLTTLDAELCGVMEPRTSRPLARLQAVEKLAAAGIPVGVNLAPIVPGLTDEEIPALLKAAFQAGARQAGYTMLRLPYGVGNLFETWLATHYPERKDRVLGLLRGMRGGKLNQSAFGSRMRGEGEYAKQIGALFRVTCQRLGLNQAFPPLNADHFRPLPQAQMELDF